MVQDLIIRAMAMPPLDTLTYLVACPDSRQGVVIDPAGGPERILAAIAELKLQIAFILNTHGHADHVSGNRLLKERLGAPVGMHAADVRFFSDAAVRRQLSRQLELPPRDPVDMRLRDGDVLKIGRRRIRVLHTPGHTPGSVCFWIDGHLFTGDTLFVGAVGRTDLPGGSLKRLVDSLACKIIGLPAETVVWPGHDYGETPFSTIGRERIENPYITDFILDREY